MSAGNLGAESGGKGGSQDFELNLASIIDCFTVLITFMLASASFLSIGILDAGVSAGGQSATKAKPPSVTVAVELGANHVMSLKLEGKAHGRYALPAKGDDWNYDALGSRLASLKSTYKDLAAVTLSAGNTVEYQEVVRTMEEIRKTLPVVMLGGF